jgi:hypothetical protein
MQSIQLVEFDASHSVDEVREAMDAWLSASRGKRPLQMALVAADHDRPNHYWNLLMFPSEQEGRRPPSCPRPSRHSRTGPGSSTASRCSTTSTSSIISAVRPLRRSTPSSGGPRALAERAQRSHRATA